jgi:cyclophilin family peptidyl-prolyl cis-trans isomerase
VPSEKRQRQREGRLSRQEELERAERQRKSRRRFIVGGAIAAVVIAVLVIANLGGDDDNSSVSSSASSTTAAPAKITGDTPCPKADGSSPRTTSFEKAPPLCIDPAKTYTATFDTTQGTVVVNLDTKKTPNTTNNFVVLSRYHYYDGTNIFRTDPSIDIIQGGAPTTQSASDPGPGYTIKDEGGKFTYSPGDLVMARTGAPDSAGAQYFFVTGDKASGLNSQGTYVVFGKVTQGLDVTQKIIGLHKEDPSSGLGGAPDPPVIVKTVTIKET